MHSFSHRSQNCFRSVLISQVTLQVTAFTFSGEVSIYYAVAASKKSIAAFQDKIKIMEIDIGILDFAAGVL